MKKSFIIKKNYYIQKIISDRRSVANKYFIAYKKDNNLQHFRFVVSISKKIGNAVVRNKLKRQIKSIFYEKKNEIIKNYDILIIVRKNTNNLKFEELKKQLLGVLNKAKLIKSEVIDCEKDF